jgi:inward rectifier potassium channel
MTDTTERNRTQHHQRPQAPPQIRSIVRAKPGAKLAIVRGQDSTRWTDVYHRTLTLPWSLFLLALLGVFIAANIFFAILYAIDPHAVSNARPGNLWDTFLFSVQTITPNEYTIMKPVTPYAHVLAVVETFTVNYAFLGIVAALMFARFSRPFARVVFSRVAIITRFDGVPTLMFRAANQRGNSILDAEATVSLASRKVTLEGIEMRRFEELRLVRSRTSLFALSWTVMHAIDEKSPLYGLTEDNLADNEVEILVMLSGVDDTLADRIYARHSYGSEDIHFDRRFADVLSVTPNGRRVVDLNRFHDTEPILTREADAP